jgi:ubiquinone/menaquinone biosynthesis C-methylase UbiE
MILDKALEPLLLVKAEKIFRHCKKYVSGRMLDVGAGRCFIAKMVHSSRIAKVTCLDVNDLSRSGMKVVVYNGKDIPFKDNKFDSALIAYVLHHCDEPIKVLKEVKRVCKGNIVIFEDNPAKMTNFMDFLSNWFRSVDTPFKFRTEKEWKDIFKKLGLRIVAVEHNVEKEWFYPFVEHIMFVVRK